MNSGIYSIIVNNEIVYVGQSKNIKRRWQFHQYELKNNKHKNIYLQRLYNKHNISFGVIELIENIDDLTSREIHYINIYNPKCNMTLPDKNDRWLPSEERNAKNSIALTGKKKSPKHSRNISVGRKCIKLNYDVWNVRLGTYYDTTI